MIMRFFWYRVHYLEKKLSDIYLEAELPKPS